MENIPQDIKKEWLSVIRAAQAACKDNRGYAVVTLRVAVNGGIPLMWAQPSVVKLHPKRASIGGITNDVFASLVALGLVDVHKVDLVGNVD